MRAVLIFFTSSCTLNIALLASFPHSLACRTKYTYFADYTGSIVLSVRVPLHEFRFSSLDPKRAILLGPKHSQIESSPPLKPVRVEEKMIGHGHSMFFCRVDPTNVILRPRSNNLRDYLPVNLVRENLKTRCDTGRLELPTSNPFGAHHPTGFLSLQPRAPDSRFWRRHNPYRERPFHHAWARVTEITPECTGQ